MDRFVCMEAFVASVDHGSLSRAARRLGRSPAAISRAITALEEHLDVTLLIRTTRTLKLTDAGGRYLEVCRRVLPDVPAAEQRAGSAVEVPHGVLTVTARAMFGTLHVRPIVDRLSRGIPRRPGAPPLARPRGQRARRGGRRGRSHRASAGLSAGRHCRHTTRRVVCASPAYLARRGKPSEPAALAEHRCISFTAITPTETWTFAPRPEGGLVARETMNVDDANATPAEWKDGPNQGARP